MATTLTPDICVIGAGSGGLSVAAAAAAFGVDVVLIEKGKMGGDCLNYGCVPSKALIAAAKHAASAKSAKKFGVNTGRTKVNFEKVHEHIHSVIGAIAPNDSVERFTSLGVHVIQDTGHFVDKNTVQAGEFKIKARRFVVSTGSSAFVPPIPGLSTIDYLTNENIFDQKEPMQHLAIIGGGPIGMELAHAHRRLGAKVTVIEGVKALSKDDPELANIALDKIRSDGVKIFEGAQVQSIEKQEDGSVKLIFSKDNKTNEIIASHVLVATGRAPNISSLGLENAGVDFDRRGIKVGSNLRTFNRKIYAIGDVTGGLQFTHVAGYHAGLVIQQILFRIPAKTNDTIIPWVTYTDPELANVGLSETQAREKHNTISILRWPYAENDRAQAEGKTDGLIKIIVSKKGKILGVGIVGANAGEMINMWSLAISNNMKIGDIRGYISPYPTMSEIGKRAIFTHYAPMARKPFVRRIINLLRKFG